MIEQEWSGEIDTKQDPKKKNTDGREVTVFPSQEENTPAAFASLLRQLREEAGLSPDGLARRILRRTDLYEKYEKPKYGKSPIVPNDSTIIRIATKGFGFSKDDPNIMVLLTRAAAVRSARAAKRRKK
jgi:ribosome-binding protein aMBF1 (putative translation factor)